MDSLTNAYTNAYEEHGWIEHTPIDPQNHSHRRALERLAAAAIAGASAEERDPGCTVKPLAWWHAEIERWHQGVEFLGEQGQ